MVKEKTCTTCLYLGTHEKCQGCLGMGQPFEYANYVEGDGIERVRQFEKEGKRDIVIGYMDEAEVNANDEPTDRFTNLLSVAEQCGYFVSRGTWTNEVKEIKVCLPHGIFVVVYLNNKLNHIKTEKGLKIWKA